MEINKNELLMMMREFWSIGNNPTCKSASIIFGRRAGLTDKEIKICLNMPPSDRLPNITLEDDNEYQEQLTDQLNYYSDED